MNAGVSRLLAEVRILTALTNHTNAIHQQANSLESTIKTLGNELSYHSEALLQRIQLHDQELGRVMVNPHFCPHYPAKFTPCRIGSTDNGMN